jgi:hypothetical protein
VNTGYWLIPQRMPGEDSVIGLKTRTTPDNNSTSSSGQPARDAPGTVAGKWFGQSLRADAADALSSGLSGGREQLASIMPLTSAKHPYLPADSF